MKINIWICIFQIALFVSQTCLGAKDPVKFGKVTIEELEMKEYLPDPDAAAVVLCSYGYYDNKSHYFTHVFRVKILKKEGYNFANRKFRVSQKSSIKGNTYNLVDGKVVVDKLSRESIYKERITEDFCVVNVAMPNVREGSVIDLHIHYFGFPWNWYFQEDVPVVWSELRIDKPHYIRFRETFFGNEPLYIRENNRWVAKDVPAFEEEPFMTSRENYITKFEFDILSISIPGYFREYSVSWESVSKILMENRQFGSVLNSGSYLNKVAKGINSKYQTQEAKIVAALDFVHETIEFNGRDRYTAKCHTLSGARDEGIGNSADINLTLIRLLEKLDFEVYPVVLSTKENGILSLVYASFQRLNYVLAYVKIGDGFVLVDGTDKYLPYYMLPKKCLNWKGRLVDKDASRWIDINTAYKDDQLSYYELSLQKDLSLTGKLSYIKMDYAAYDIRKKLENYNSIDEYVEYLTKGHPDIEIIDAKITGIEDVYGPVKEEYEVRITNHAQSIGNTVYLTMTLLEKIEDNPFKAEERRYPIDLNYPVLHRGVVKISLPEYFIVEEIPEQVHLLLPNNDATFTFSISNINNTIMLNYKLAVNKELFLETEYGDLKAFYNEVVNKESEPIIITVK
ncbi:MAG: hypothetical protein B6D64_06515 [Bacteroidetes bacterium 4484_276]|nr:MAG: hypothetical protein B6D64_06515 [Bacteroidetes bacterium 4484_276]OYT14414.1 MAG: hypothetical protein B6I19_00265 [Bacteroidetes bacterium 4572_114]